MKGQKIIIKKVKKVSGEGGHGGSWKVAYADFVTAMMAFFLLLWLITMVSPEKRARVANYFKHYSVFEQSGSSFMEKSSEVFNEAGQNMESLTGETANTQKMKAEQFSSSLKTDLENKLGDIQDQVMIEVFEGGVRIQLVDKEGNPMFNLGSAKPTSLLLSIMKVIGDNIKDLPNPVTIEGHTDSLAYKSSGYSNWELSTERALSTRKELELSGLDPGRLVKIAGYADTIPYIKEDKTDQRNRRVSVILSFAGR